MAGPSSWQRLEACRLQIAGLASGSWAWSASVAGGFWCTYCVPDVLVLVHNFSWESVKGQLSVLHLGGD